MVSLATVLCENSFSCHVNERLCAFNRFSALSLTNFCLAVGTAGCFWVAFSALRLLALPLILRLAVEGFDIDFDVEFEAVLELIASELGSTFVEPLAKGDEIAGACFRLLGMDMYDVDRSNCGKTVTCISISGQLLGFGSLSLVSSLR
jgi:hypothetical protein